MKKIVCTLLAVLLWVNTLSAQSFETVLLMQIDNPVMFLVNASGEKQIESPAPPFIQNGVTLLPIRAVSELFGAEVTWQETDKQITITQKGTAINMWVGKSGATVNGQPVDMPSPPVIVNGTTMVPVRFVAESLRLTVSFLDELRTVVISESAVSSDVVNGFECVAFYRDALKQNTAKPTQPASGSGVAFSTRSVATSSGNVSADVITVDLSSGVKVKTVLVDNALNHTASFKDIVATYKPLAAVNGNFFNAYDAIQDPVGTVMVNGNILYGSSGLTSLGITQSGTAIIGTPGIFTEVYTVGSGDSKVYTAFEVNVFSQAGEQAVLYTPARGTSVPITAGGSVMVVDNNAITGYYDVNPGDTANIPSNGYIVFFSYPVINSGYFSVPEIGRQVAVRYRLFTDNGEPFPMEGVQQMVSGSPRLVKQGAIDNTPLVGGFAGDSRFTANSAPRTAVGITSDGKLLLVGANCTIDTLKEVMLGLGATEAFNLDGGASNAMYAEGRFIRQPGRNLTSVLMVTAE